MRPLRKDNKALSHRQEVIARKVADRIIQAQRRLADYLSGRTKGLSGKAWLVLLIFFCAAFGSYSLYLLMQAFY